MKIRIDQSSWKPQLTAPFLSGHVQLRFPGSLALRGAAAWVLFTALAGAPPVFAEVALGRLFLTVDERVELEYLRRHPAPADAPASGTPDAVSAAPPRIVAPVRVDGYVVRRDGRGSAWLNSRMIHDHLPTDDGVQAAGAQLPDVTVRLADGRVLQLRVGQTYDPVSGTTLELFQRSRATPGAIAEGDRVGAGVAPDAGT